jgi:hypothetical protein
MKALQSSPRSRILLGICCLVAVAASAFALGQEEQDATPSPPLQPDEGQLRAYIELVRMDVQTEKATILAVHMKFTEDEAFEFWPLHREYSLALNKVFDLRLALIRKHIGEFDNMTDEQARELANDVFDLEDRRLKLKRVWFDKFSEAISAKRAAQFFQIENQINAAIDLRVAASLPLIQ